MNIPICGYIYMLATNNTMRMTVFNLQIHFVEKFWRIFHLPWVSATDKCRILYSGNI